MYIDAGTGSMLLQAAAGFFTCLVFFRQSTAWFKAQFIQKGKASHEHIIDPATAEALYKLSKTKCPNITPVLQDLNNPTPGLGMFNLERTDFYSRCHGDLVMGLALIHHLCISGNWPLTHIVKLFADMSSNAALVEFVPRSDSQVQRLLHSRTDIFDDWTLEDVIKAFREEFSICNTIPIPDSGRVLLELYR